MRLAAATLVVATFLGASTLAHADGVTFVESIVATGSIGSDNFTNSLVTLTSQLTAQQLATSLAAQSYTAGGDFFFDFSSGLTTTISIAGIGTFLGENNYVVTNEEDGGLYIGDVEGRLALQTFPLILNFQSSVGPATGNGDIIDGGCDAPFGPCPGIFSTSGGDVTISSFDSSTGSGEMLVSSAVPEPPILVLFLTGLLGMVLLIRYRYPSLS